MDPVRTASKISRYKSGLFSASELAQSLLWHLLSEPELDMSFLASVGSLPDEVRREFLDLVRRIRSADYYWKPFLITTVKDRILPPDHPEKLRRVCRFLEDNWTDEDELKRDLTAPTPTPQGDGS